jgi:IclR family pca regulon transcriptional regulator
MAKTLANSPHPPAVRPAPEPAAVQARDPAPADGAAATVRSRRPERQPAKDFVGSLARGLSVITAFDAEKPEMTLTEVAARTDLTRAGARRFLLTLESLGYVRRNQRLFRLGPKVLELGYAFLASTPVSEKARPYMREITAHTGESCSLSVLDGEDIVYIARSPAKRLLTLDVHVGSRLPAAYTSMGRVLLAFREPPIETELYLRGLELRPANRHSLKTAAALREELVRTRERGYALVDQELEEGLRSISVPVRDPAGNVIAAMNISVNASTAPVEKLTREFLPILKSTAEEIRATLDSRTPV